VVNEYSKELLILKKENKASVLCRLNKKELIYENLITACNDKYPLIISIELIDDSNIGIYAEYGIRSMNPLTLFEIMSDNINFSRLSNPSIELISKEICISEKNQKFSISFTPTSCKVMSTLKSKKTLLGSTTKEFVEIMLDLFICFK